MPIPEYVRQLRQHVGHAPLWLPGVTAVVLRRDEVLLVQRSDTFVWTPVTGIVDPGEQPAVAAAREVLEETGVSASVERLASVRAGPMTVHVNGDQVYYLDHCFTCAYVSGEAYVGDDESVDVGWFPLTDLPEMPPIHQQRIRDATEPAERARFDV
jgi:8-oxo-dGTP pyrophosphatase MutT (NUDIX family)